jgi:hypothetical protein
MPRTADTPMLTRREAVEIAHVPLGALDKAIEQNIVTVHRRRDHSWLRSEDVGVVALLQKTALPLPITVKRKIRRWVRETEPYRAGHDSELHISDALVVRWSSEAPSREILTRARSTDPIMAHTATGETPSDLSARRCRQAVMQPLAHSLACAARRPTHLHRDRRAPQHDLRAHAAQGSRQDPEHRRPQTRRHLDIERVVQRCRPGSRRQTVVRQRCCREFEFLCLP